MRYFLDTEFMESPGQIELISIGIKCEDGRIYYAVNKDFNPENANEWVVENVFPYLVHDGKPLEPEAWKSIDEIRKELLNFIDKEPQFYAYFASYDWVAFCSCIFGRMIDLPEYFPKYINDVKSFANLIQETLKFKILPIEDQENEHHALADAKYTEMLYNLVMNYLRIYLPIKE